jgi:predicted small secreted protein
MLKRLFTLTFVLAFMVALIGCNTIHGLGQDLAAVGEGVQEAAE